MVVSTDRFDNGEGLGILPVKCLPFILFLIFLVIPGMISFSQAWDFIKEKDGIKVYTRQEKNSTLKSFRGEADIQASWEKVYAIVGSVRNNDRWDESIREFRVLSNVKDKTFSYYLIYKLPWPLTDRDLCVEANISRDTTTGEVVILAKSLPNRITEDNGLVRIRNYWQTWIIQPLGKNSVHLILEGMADPSGNIPAWIYNSVITNTPVKMIQQVRERVVQ